MKTKAFTFLEIMLVIVLLSAGLGFALLYTQSSQVRTDVNTQAANLVSYLRQAQSNAASGKNSTNHGVHFGTGSYVIFEGSSYVSSASGNFTVELPETMVIQNISLNGGGSDVIFTRPLGETSTYGSLEIHSEQINKTRTINIQSIGTIDYE